MIAKRRHLGEAKRATTASEKVRQPRKLVKGTNSRGSDKCHVLHVTRKHSGREEEAGRTDRLKPLTSTPTSTQQGILNNAGSGVHTFQDVLPEMFVHSSAV